MQRNSPAQTSVKVKRNSGKAPSCDICRHRRVACDRPDPNSACGKCTVHGIRCTTTHTYRRTKIQSGKRIGEAKMAYGTTELATISVGTHSPDGRVVARELAGLLGSHLVEIFLNKNGKYMDKAHLLLPIIQWPDFQARFEACGRRASDMDPDDELICNIVLASAAQITDHPCILGPSAPALNSLRQMPATERCQLYRYGNARESACRALCQRAQQLCDERGVWRSPSPTSVATLLLMNQLVCGGEISAREGRVYLSAALEQLRALDWDDKARSVPPIDRVRPIDGGHAVWTTMLMDAFTAAEAGRELLTSDEDYSAFTRRNMPHGLPSIEELRCALSLPPPVFSLASLESYMATKDTEANGSVILPVWHTILLIARDIVKSLTCQSARRRPTFDALSVQSAWKKLDDVSQWARSATLLRCEREWPASRFFEVYFGLMWQSCCSLESIIMQVLSERVAERQTELDHTFAQMDEFSRALMGLPHSSDREYQILTLLLVNSRSRVENIVRDVVTIPKSTNGIDTLVLATGSFWSVTRLQALTHVLVAMPISVHNTVDQKLAAIDSMLESVVHAAWTWPALKKTITTLQSERDSLISHMTDLAALMSWPMPISDETMAEQQLLPPETGMEAFLQTPGPYPFIYSV